MSVDTSEKAIEKLIVEKMIQEVQKTSSASWEGNCGGYFQRKLSDYSLEYELIPDDLFDFLIATQPEEWQKLRKIYGADVREKFLQRLRQEIERKGTLHIFRICHGNYNLRLWNIRFRFSAAFRIDG